MTDEAGPGRAATYDAWYATPLGAAAHRIELGLVAELAEPLREEKALDAGCGTGIYSGWLAGLGLSVTGVDHDSEMLEAARHRVPEGRFVEAGVTDLPFADGEFDLAVAITVSCFLSAAERRAAARELVRVTRPGGRMVVGELARYSLWAAQRRVKGWLGSATWHSARFMTAGELKSCLLDAGAAAVTVRHALYVPPVDRAAVVTRAETCERLGQRLGSFGAAFVAARADVAR